jgi:hypothetical protein
VRPVLLFLRSVRVRSENRPDVLLVAVGGRGTRRRPPLGPVGSRVVAETLVGILDADPTSYRTVHPAWQPTLAGRDGGFTVPDLLRFAGVVPR